MGTVANVALEDWFGRDTIGHAMKIILANPRGFCAGVNMAIECVDKVLRHQGAPVYVYHEIVHNKHVVDDFVSRGVTFVNGIDEVPEGRRWSTALTAYPRGYVQVPDIASSSKSTRP